MGVLGFDIGFGASEKCFFFLCSSLIQFFVVQIFFFNFQDSLILVFMFLKCVIFCVYP